MQSRRPGNAAGVVRDPIAARRPRFRAIYTLQSAAALSGATPSATPRSERRFLCAQEILNGGVIAERARTVEGLKCFRHIARRPEQMRARRPKGR